MALIKYGNITEVIPDKGMVRVEFKEDDLVSFPLPVLEKRTKNDQYFHSFDINERVVCLMDPGMENGVVLGAIYDKANTPPSGGSEDVSRVVFSDGTKVEYNRGSSVLEVNVSGTKVKVAPAGVEISTAAESLNSILSDLITQIIAETHLCAGPGNPSGPPINLGQYTAIQGRLNLLFTG